MLTNLLELFVVGLPIWVVCIGALLCLSIDAISSKGTQTLVIGTAILSLLTAIITAVFEWQELAIVSESDFLRIDALSLFLMILIFLAGIVSLLNLRSAPEGEWVSESTVLLLLSIVGMVFLFVSNNLLLNFIGLETMSLAVYVLVGSKRGSLFSSEAAIKYFIMGGVASAILLFGIAFHYGAFATVTVDLANKTQPELAFLANISMAFLLIGLFFKMATVPFHFWAPDVYEGAPAPITGFMATAVKVAAVGFGLRLFSNFGLLELLPFQNLLKVIVIATLLVANVAAVMQNDIKRMLAYSSISHAGFILFGILASFTAEGFDEANMPIVLYYLAGYTFMSLGAFAVLSLMTKDKAEATHYDNLKGLAKHHPYLSVVFTIFMISMIGIPGTVGFAAKYGVISLAVQNGHVNLAVLSVLMTIISAFYYLRPSVVMFFSSPDKEKTDVITGIPYASLVAITACAFLVIYFGILPDTLLLQFSRAGAG